MDSLEEMLAVESEEQNEELLDDTADNEAKADDTSTNGDDGNEPPEGESETNVNNATGNGAEGSLDNNDSFIDIEFSDGVRSLSRDEATAYILRGSELEGLHKKLDYLASVNGKSVDEYLEELLKNREDAYRRELETKVTDESTIDDLMEVYRTREKEKYNEVLLGRKNAEEAAKVTRENQIADSFIELQKEFPEITEYKLLPEEVRRSAAKGENLLSAYLLHMHKEQKAVKKAEETAAAAKAASSGSVSTEKADGEKAYITDFEKGLFGK